MSGIVEISVACGHAVQKWLGYAWVWEAPSPQ